MKVKQTEYDNFRNFMLIIKNKLQLNASEFSIGDAPMTIRFLKSILLMLSEAQQMYYEEIKDEKDKAFDAECTKRLFEVHNCTGRG